MTAISAATATASTTATAGDQLGHCACRRKRSALKGEFYADRQGQNTC
jgi:hypothetical protein